MQQVSEVDQATASAQLLNFMHDGGRALEAHAATQFQERLAAQLDKAMSFYYGVFGSLTLVSGSRSAVKPQSFTVVWTADIQHRTAASWTACHRWQDLLDIEFKPGCRGLADLGAKDRYAGLPAACVAGLQCAPFVMSSAWAAAPEQMAEELAAYSINLESSVRKASDPACWHAPAHHWQGCWQVSDLSCLLHWCYTLVMH
jgi:hypothetical protein